MVRNVMISVKFQGTYYETLSELLEEQPIISSEIDRRIKWFQKNPNDTRLENHQLKDRMYGKWAFSITSDIRIVYEWLGKNTVRFLAIGKHTQVYSRRSLRIFNS